MTHEEDPLGAMRGILFALILSACYVGPMLAAYIYLIVR